jgi:isoleucyl-tRNA synthetase
VILAPFTPFLAEELFAKLTGGILGESVHLLDWPKDFSTDEKVLADMKRTREIIAEGLRLRMEEPKIKIRQPLSKLEYSGKKLSRLYEEIIEDEVNVKLAKHVVAPGETGTSDKTDKIVPKVMGVIENWPEPVYSSEDGGLYGVLIDKKQTPELRLYKHLTPELKREGLSREIVRIIQNARKQAGLNVDDRIAVNITTNDDELQQAINEHRDTIATEILATEFAENDGYETFAKIDGAELTIQLKKDTK